MLRRNSRLRVWKWLLCLSLIGVGCLTQMTTPVAHAGPPTPIPYNTWIPFARGADYMWKPYFTADNQWLRGYILVARVYPDRGIFRVYYKPGERKSVHDWSVELPGAELIVNASYFDGASRPQGLLRIGGDVFGPVSGRADSGELLIANEAPRILPAIRPDTVKVDSNAPYSEAMEGYPVLISRGKVMPFADDTSLHERRSILAQDADGNLLIIFTSNIELSLRDLARWIANSGLGVVTALNMDGGTSAQVHITTTDDLSRLVENNVPVPVVLAIFPR